MARVLYPQPPAPSTGKTAWSTPASGPPPSSSCASSPSCSAPINALELTLEASSLFCAPKSTTYTPDSPPPSPEYLLSHAQDARVQRRESLPDGGEGMPWLSRKETHDGRQLSAAGVVAEEEKDGNFREAQAPDTPPITPPAGETLFAASTRSLEEEEEPRDGRRNSSVEASTSTSFPSESAALSPPASRSLPLSHFEQPASCSSLLNQRSPLPSPSSASSSAFAASSSSSQPASPRSRKQPLPSLSPLIIPKRSPSSPSRSRSRSARSSGSSSPTSPSSPTHPSVGVPASRPRSPTKRARKPSVISLVHSTSNDRGRTSGVRKANEEGSSRHRRCVSASALPSLPPVSPVSPTSPSRPPLSPSSLPASPKNERHRSVSLPLPLPPTPPHSPPLSRQLNKKEAEEEVADERAFAERFQSLPLLRLRHALSLAASLATYRASSALALSGRLPPSSRLLGGPGGAGTATPAAAAGKGGGGGAAGWQREQYRLYAMGRAKAQRMGGVGYWEGRGFELE
ncbi:hypothetical protein JCM10213_003409 [Rhodosporidiobolus nylandii]